GTATFAVLARYLDAQIKTTRRTMLPDWATPNAGDADDPHRGQRKAATPALPQQSPVTAFPPPMQRAARSACKALHSPRTSGRASWRWCFGRGEPARAC